MFSILVVEDDLNTRKLMAAVLRNNGFETIAARDGESALEAMEKQHVDLIVLDIMMPGLDGFELTKALRETGNNLPILMVSAKYEAKDKQKGFYAGTDDYMVKPVDEEEMVLRIKALLRRAQIAQEHKLVIGATTLDYDTLSVACGETNISLPQKEFQLLFKLLSYPGVIFTRMQLMDEIWGLESDTDDHTVNVHINRLRNKLSNNPDFKIATVRNLGYKAVKANA